MKYYIIRSDGCSIFLQPYPYDFCMHCLLKLLDVSDEKYYLLNFTDTSLLPAVQAERGTGDESPVLAFWELLKQ